MDCGERERDTEKEREREGGIKQLGDDCMAYFTSAKLADGGFPGRTGLTILAILA